jgi:hypothetical protein
MAVAPELIVPGIAFDKLMRVSSDKLVREFTVAELRFQNLLHDENSHVLPVFDDSNLAAATFSDQRSLRFEDPSALAGVDSFQRLVRVLGCRIDVVAYVDWVAVEVAEEVCGASKIINQVLLFCCSDSSLFKDIVGVRQPGPLQRIATDVGRTYSGLTAGRRVPPMVAS